MQRSAQLVPPRDGTRREGTCDGWRRDAATQSSEPRRTDGQPAVPVQSCTRLIYTRIAFYFRHLNRCVRRTFVRTDRKDINSEVPEIRRRICNNRLVGLDV